MRPFVSIASLLLVFFAASQLRAATAAEVFLKLPEIECGGYPVEERRFMLDTRIPNPGADGRPSVPDVEKPWVTVVSDRYLVLHRPGGLGNISYKLFAGTDFELMAVCRGRQRGAPFDPEYQFDLALYFINAAGLVKVEQSDFMPGISILDFITPDTLMDPAAVRDISARAPHYNRCLTCNSSVHDRDSLDIITVTTINSAACVNFLPPYGLLPLTWAGRHFTKPYNRAAPRDGAYE